MAIEALYKLIGGHVRDVSSGEASELWERFTDDGAAIVASGDGGQFSSYFLLPDNANAADSDDERIFDEYGISQFRMSIIAPAALGSITAYMIGWSTTYNDLSTVNTAMALAAAQIAAPTGTQVDNVIVLFPNDGTAGEIRGGVDKTDWISLLGYRAKTIAVRTVGADSSVGVMVEAIK